MQYSQGFDCWNGGRLRSLIVGHPFDTIKVKLQSQQPTSRQLPSIPAPLMQQNKHSSEGLKGGLIIQLGKRSLLVAGGLPARHSGSRLPNDVVKSVIQSMTKESKYSEPLTL
ncbi:hypothetical protein ACMD2_12642 [Ananas comosus]|uniref:Uncharacterized protein n=1 Tax=Ananas comosus TaxID=4615 RepID=A0A199UDW6_ANACO|nr:hypothetical protein ACMD2_12642 [Ananas comosus]